MGAGAEAVEVPMRALVKRDKFACQWVGGSQNGITIEQCRCTNEIRITIHHSKNKETICQEPINKRSARLRASPVV